MTIQEAIQSGKPFRRHNHIEFMDIDPYGVIFSKETGAGYYPICTDIIADDWEIKEEPYEAIDDIYTRAKGK